MGAFVLSLRERSYFVSVMLSANGIIHAISVLGDLGISSSLGPVIAFIFGLVTIGLGVAKGIGTTRASQRQELFFVGVS